MSRKIRFEDETQDPRNSDSSVTDNTKSKQRKQRKLEHEDIRSESQPQTSAAPNEPTGVALPLVGENSVGNNAPNGGVGFTGLQQGAANFIRSISPDETPDRNTAVSASRFSLEAGATIISKLTANQKSKSQSKLKNKDSALRFEQSELKTENTDTPSHEATDTEQSENENGTDEPDGEAKDDASENVIPDEATDTLKNNNTKETADAPDPSEQSLIDTNTETGVSTPLGSTSDNPKSRLRFSKDEKAITKLEKRADKLDKKLEKAQEKLPAKTVKVKTLEFDEGKSKAVSKLTHAKEKIPIGEAKWNNPKDKVLPAKAAGAVTSIAVTKIHTKIHQVEHENVGIKVTHKAELLTESGYRGVKQTARSAYRFHKNRPYRRLAKLERKSIKNKIRLDYKKALRDNPKLKSNPLSRFMQKRAIKRNYAKQLRAAKKAAHTTGKAVGFTAKAAKVVTAILRKNPVFLVKGILLLLMVFLILSMFSMCMGMFSGTSSFIGSVTYAADFGDIDDASIKYTELETDLRIYINDIQTNYPGYNEYRLNIDSIGHDPFALMVFLTAVYEDFTFAEVAATIQEIFDAQYALETESVIEIRTREEERTGVGSWTDVNGVTHLYTYTYTVTVEYEWHILYVTMTSRSFTEILLERMDDDQTHHFYILMYSKGARQFVGNPFDFDWRPFVSSLYGYRINPISGEKQFHWGLDIGLPEGTPILAGLDGTVIAVGYDAGGYGNFIVIECADGNQVRYAHCHTVSATVGQMVSRGDVVATVGNTGASTGAHLHIEVSRDGRRLNPIFFLEF
ncbi:MAG: peptidoglycan DD-metalloendopeptidase family protein [Defluviitaleaceae bacterium]|nr:peptidoglycan DD-metalloendopeptidase family protein [Defluviitaleaceae bacterium]